MKKKTVSCLLLLGSNKGDRGAYLRRAIKALNHLSGISVRACSHIYETAPLGPSRRAYFNMAVRIETTLSAMGLLIDAKRLEAAAGRRTGPRWSARTLDIDIITYGTCRLRGHWLTLPHPRVAERAFALAPLAEIAPHFRLISGVTVAALLRRLNPSAGIVRIVAHGQ